MTRVLSEILNSVKNEREVKEISSFMLSYTYPVLLINIKITRQLHYLLRAVQIIKEIVFFLTKRINHLSYKYLKVSDYKTCFSILRQKKL